MFSECREIKSINEIIMALVLRNLPANAGDTEKQVRSLGWADPLEDGMAIQSSTLAWILTWLEEPGRLRSMGHKESDMTHSTHAMR